jgi:acetyl esterase/lipase
MKTLLSTVMLLAITLAAGAADKKPVLREDRTYPPNMPGAVSETFKRVGDVDLKIYIVNPADLKPGDKRPAVVFFFGGGWKNGSPAMFLYQCRYLASRGVVAISADYRVADRNGVKAAECVRDAKAAMRYVRASATRLGIDPDKIAAAGGSAGGHLAAAVGLVPGFDETGDDATGISPAPNAMLLFNPGALIAPDAASTDKKDQERYARMKKAMGVEPRDLAPGEHVRPALPPTLIMIGTADPAFAAAQQYADRLKHAGNRCDLRAYEGEPHGFFNLGRKNNAPFASTLKDVDHFLTSLNWLTAPDTVDAFVTALGG